MIIYQPVPFAARPADNAIMSKGEVGRNEKMRRPGNAESIIAMKSAFNRALIFFAMIAWPMWQSADDYRHRCQPATAAFSF